MTKFPKVLLVFVALAAFSFIVGINIVDDTPVGYINIMVGFVCLAIFGKYMTEWCNQRADEIERKARLDEI